MNRRADLDALMPARDNEGYLLEPADWSHALAPLLAAEDGLTLTARHWQVLDFIRAWYADTESVPEARRAIDHLAGPGGDKRRQARALRAVSPRLRPAGLPHRR